MPCKVTLFYRDRQEVTINKKAEKTFIPQILSSTQGQPGQDKREFLILTKKISTSNQSLLRALTKDGSRLRGGVYRRAYLFVLCHSVNVTV